MEWSAHYDKNALVRILAYDGAIIAFYTQTRWFLVPALAVYLPGLTANERRELKLTWMQNALLKIQLTQTRNADVKVPGMCRLAPNRVPRRNPQRIDNGYMNNHQMPTMDGIVLKHVEDQCLINTTISADGCLEDEDDGGNTQTGGPQKTWDVTKTGGAQRVATRSGILCPGGDMRSCVDVAPLRTLTNAYNAYNGGGVSNLCNTPPIHNSKRKEE